MSLSSLIDLGATLAALTAIAVGVGCALSVAWASVAVGSIVLSLVVFSRMRGSRKE